MRSVFTTTLDLRASGNVEDYDESTITGIRTSLANVAGVNVNDVSLSITSASVRMAATIKVASSTAMIAATAAVSSAMHSAEATSALLNVNVTDVPSVASVVTVEVLPAPSPPPFAPPSPPLPPPAYPPPHLPPPNPGAPPPPGQQASISAGLILGAVAVTLGATLASGLILHRRRSKGRQSPPARGKRSPTAENPSLSRSQMHPSQSSVDLLANGVLSALGKQAQVLPPLERGFKAHTVPPAPPSSPVSQKRR